MWEVVKEGQAKEGLRSHRWHDRTVLAQGIGGHALGQRLSRGDIPLT